MSLAFVFPGQGSQSQGMTMELAEHYPVVNDIFRQASDVLGYDLLQLVREGPAEKLNQTEVTQPALLTAGYATWRVWQENGGTVPEMLAGHSLGEYTALVCAGGLDFVDAVALVADRGRFMQAAVPAGSGAMAAILGLGDEEVADLCERVSSEDEIVSAANFNANGQVVIAGHTAAVKRAIEEAKATGAKRSVLLPVSVPSHCRLMLPAAGKLMERLQDIHITPGTIPVIHNVDVSIKTSPDSIRQALAGQLSHPVRWVETIGSMTEQGITRIVECGPGKVLCGLIKRIDRQVETLPVYDPDSMTAGLTAMKEQACTEKQDND